MLKIKTSRFGEINVSENDLIYLPEGLIGFSTLNHFALINDKGSDFKWLQSLDEDEFAILIARPDFLPDYKVDISKYDAESIKLVDTKNAVFFVIVTIPEDVKNMSVNLQAPLILNLKDKIAKQVVLSDEELYPTKHFVFRKIKETYEHILQEE